MLQLLKPARLASGSAVRQKQSSCRRPRYRTVLARGSTQHSQQNFHIRSIAPSDVCRLAAIEQQCKQFSAGWTAADIEAELGNSLSRAATAVDSTTNEPLGYIVCWVVAGELQVLECAVDPAYQSRGIGSALLQHMLRTHSAPQGAVLEVKAHNQRAIQLYERHGFEQVGRRANFYADGSDALLMATPSTDETS